MVALMNMDTSEAIEVVKIPLIEIDGVKKYCTLKISGAEPYSIEIESELFASRKFTGIDLFDWLSKLRSFLEEKNILIVCNGARTDVYPSGMSRGMSGGRLAYVMRMGESAHKIDLVDIFGIADQGYVGTIDQQKEYHLKWVKSLRNI